MQNKYKDKGVVMVALSPEARGRVGPFIQSAKINYVVGAEARSAAARFRVNSYPTIFVFDPDGQMVYRGHWAPEAEQVIDRTLKQKPPRAAST